MLGAPMVTSIFFAAQINGEQWFNDKVNKLNGHKKMIKKLYDSRILLLQVIDLYLLYARAKVGWSLFLNSIGNIS